MKRAPATLSVIGLAFTILYGYWQHQNARDQIEITLVPLLASQDAEVRTRALRLTARLAPELAPGASADLVGDPDQRTSKIAFEALKKSAESQESAIQVQAKEEITRLSVSDALRAGSLLPALDEARHLMALDASAAVLKFRSVLTELPGVTRSKLDQTLLSDAEKDADAGNFDLAARRYDALFLQYQ